MRKNDKYRMIQAILAWLTIVSLGYWLIALFMEWPVPSLPATIITGVYLLYAAGFRKAHTKMRKLADAIVDLTEAVKLDDAIHHPFVWNTFREFAYDFAVDLKPHTASKMISVFDKANSTSAFKKDLVGEALIRKVNELRDLWNSLTWSQRHG